MAEPERLKLGSRPLRLGELRRVYAGPLGVAIDAAALGAVREAHAVTARLAAGDAPVYGINTGFGLLANTRIAPAQRTLLQRNIILSHSAGVGPLLDDAIVRLTLVLKLASLLQGFSGVSVELVRFLERLINSGLTPCVPAQGSVGASGDLAPLAHLSLAVLGLGEIRRHGEVLPAAEALAQEGLAPLALGPKEGLALLNGTQVSTALALAGLFELETVFAAAVVSGAMSLDALQGSDAPFDARIHHVRGHDGQARVAQVYRELLEGSAIRESHRTCSRVQDPYSLRCQPQVMGACLDLMSQQAATLAVEANAVTDNPLIFPEAGEALSGGNFHAEPVAFAADILALACAEVGSLAERRLALLIDPNMSGLPPFLAPDSGVNSGFMMAQVTAAALVAENRMPPGERRQHSDFGEPGRSREHGHARRAAAARHDGQRAERRRARVSRRLSGVGSQGAAQDLGATRGCPRGTAASGSLRAERPAARTRHRRGRSRRAPLRGAVARQLRATELPLRTRSNA